MKTRRQTSLRRHARFWGLVVSLVVSCGLIPCARSQEAQWIWANATQGEIPTGSCHFRKTLLLESPKEGAIAIAADDTYELYLNGKLLDTSSSRGNRLTEYDIGTLLIKGKNLIAVKVTNTEGGTAAFAARVAVQEDGQPPRYYSTDASWRTNVRPFPLWNLGMYNDGRWASAREFGQYGRTPPWDDVGTRAEEQAPRPQSQLRSEPQRFQIAEGFQIERVVDGDQTGPLTAMAFNEFGHLLAARDKGPLLLIQLGEDSPVDERVRVYCDHVKNCQGILPLNSQVFVTADGAEGPAVYRLSDEDRDGRLEKAQPIVRFRGPAGEHGAHGLALGPDGMIYVVAGNYTEVEGVTDPDSPYRGGYEGDLVQPRVEDPRGYAAGRKAPGGIVFRTDPEGQLVQIVAGGLQNPRDLAFHRDGELFVHDADMEPDRGTPWYRPTRLYHVIPGAEFGWRSGWAKWPDYYVDSLPGVLDTGRGVPTGAVFYHHQAFPARFQNSLFLADRSHERILAVALTEKGASYTATSTPLLEGHPFQVVDLDVGPDGCLYAAADGSGEMGGIYRIRWGGKPPRPVPDLEGISAAIRQPQFQSAWARQRIAALMNEFGSSWGTQLAGVARSTNNPAVYRVRALQIMQLFGPAPERRLLDQLSTDPDPAVRAAAAWALGQSEDSEALVRLEPMLADSSAVVRRAACEGLSRAGGTCGLDKLSALLKSNDRHEAWAARRLLERCPVATWREQVLTSAEPQVFIRGGLALLVAHGEHENARAIVDRTERMLTDAIPDTDFIDLLRVTQLAMIKGNLAAQDLPNLGKKLADEFPSRNDAMNRELVRLLIHLGASEPLPRYLEYLKSPAPDVEKLHLAMHLGAVNSGWQEGQRVEVIEFLERSRRQAGGTSYAGYITNAERDFAKSLTPAEGGLVLSKGTEWPGAAIGVLYNLPESLDDDVVQALCDLDNELASRNDEAVQQLRVGLIAVLGHSKNERAMTCLRQAWEREPERRGYLAMGLAQSPDGANYDLLLRSLPVLEGPAAREVLGRLATVNRTPEDPNALRNVILLGLSLRERGGSDAVKLLNRWNPKVASPDGMPWNEALVQWQRWFAQQYPDLPAAEQSAVREDSKWDFQQLVEHLSRPDGMGGSAERGLAVFDKAGCIRCHRLHDRGELLGVDLTAIGQRQSRREILESIMVPALRMAREHTPTTLITSTGRTYTGLVHREAGGRWTVLQNSGAKVTIAAGQVQESAPSRQSIMPDNLLDPLTIEEITDLFAALHQPPSRNVARQPALPRPTTILPRR